MLRQRIKIGNSARGSRLAPAAAPADLTDILNRLTALETQAAALQTQFNALQTAINSRATKPTMGEFDPGFSDPPTLADLQNIQTAFNELVVQLQGG